MYPKSKICIIIAVVLLFIGGIMYLFMGTHQATPQICCSSTCFTIELAQTPAERETWLMFRESLPEDAGMLFIFPTEQPYSFRMKNTLIPLDMLRLNADFQIVDIQQADPCIADPCPSYIPSTKAKYVLELNQGISKKQQIEIWNQCSLSL